MSDKKKPLDLETAQRLYIAAGSPEQAKAAGFVIDAVRNTVQGEWGQAFVNSLEGMLERHIAPLVEGQKETHSGIAALSKQFQTLAETVDGLQKALDDIQAWRTGADERMAKIEQDDRNDIRTEIKNTNLEIVSMKAILKQYDGQLRELVERLAERGGGEDAPSDNGDK